MCRSNVDARSRRERTLSGLSPDESPNARIFKGRPGTPRRCGSISLVGEYCEISVLWNGDMKRVKKNTNKISTDAMKEAAAKYGVQVIDMSERGVRAVGILGGVRKQGPEPNKNKTTDPAGRRPSR